MIFHLILNLFLHLHAILENDNYCQFQLQFLSEHVNDGYLKSMFVVYVYEQKSMVVFFWDTV